MGMLLCLCLIKTDISLEHRQQTKEWKDPSRTVVGILFFIRLHFLLTYVLTPYRLHSLARYRERQLLQVLYILPASFYNRRISLLQIEPILPLALYMLWELHRKFRDSPPRPLLLKFPVIDIILLQSQQDRHFLHRG